MKAIPMLGRTFTRLTVLSANGVLHRKHRWLCRCECGAEVTVVGVDLRRGHPMSCGCLSREARAEAQRTHGMTRTRPYRIWRNMIDRCGRQRCHAYKDYGGRNISVCAEWRSFAVFWEWAQRSGYRGDLTLDRVNNDGNYEPGNCRWATLKQQANNRRPNPREKLTPELIASIRDDDRLHRLIAADYGIARQYVAQIKGPYGAQRLSQCAALRRAQAVVGLVLEAAE